MSITVPASADVIEVSAAATPAVVNSRQDPLAAQPNPTADNIVWGTMAAEDIACGAPPGGHDIIWQTLVDGDGRSGGSAASPSS
jgi:hypothetical protein